MDHSINLPNPSTRVYEEYVSLEEKNDGLRSDQFVQGQLVVIPSDKAQQAFLRVQLQEEVSTQLITRNLMNTRLSTLLNRIRYFITHSTTKISMSKEKKIETER